MTGDAMTIEMLYQWEKDNNVEDYDIMAYGDAGGGEYHIDSGDIEIDDTNKEVVIG